MKAAYQRDEVLLDDIRGKQATLAKRRRERLAGEDQPAGLPRLVDPRGDDRLALARSFPGLRGMDLAQDVTGTDVERGSEVMLFARMRRITKSIIIQMI